MDCHNHHDNKWYGILRYSIGHPSWHVYGMGMSMLWHDGRFKCHSNHLCNCDGIFLNERKTGLFWLHWHIKDLIITWWLSSSAIFAKQYAQDREKSEREFWFLKQLFNYTYGSICDCNADWCYFPTLFTWGQEAAYYFSLMCHCH